MTEGQTPQESHKEIMEMLLGKHQEMMGTMDSIMKSLVAVSGKAGLEVAEIISESAKTGLKAMEASFKNLDISSIFKTKFAGVATEFGSLVSRTSEMFENSDLKELLIDIGFEEGSLSKVKDGIGEIVNKDFAIKFGAYLAVEELFSGLDRAAKIIEKQEKKILATSRSGEIALRGMISPLSDDRAFSSLSTGLSAYRSELLDVINEFGVAQEEGNKAFAALTGAGLNLEQLQKLKVVTSESGESITGLKAAFLAAKATGLDFTTVAEQLNRQIRTLGVETTSAASVFETMQRVQANTTMSMKSIAEAVSSGQEKMKFFGDATMSSETVLKGFLNTLGKGREELAKPLFDLVIDGIKNMDFGVRSFIGMASGIGGGGGGPIGAGLRVEEALTSGEGIEEVLMGVKDQIEKFSGAQILTRKEAVDTGQEQQFEMQRRLLEQFLGVRGGQEQNLALEMFQKSDFSGIRDQLKPTGAISTGLAEESIAVQTGAISRMTNKIDALKNIGLTEELSQNITSASGAINEGSKSFRDVADSLRKLFGSKLEAAFSGTSEKALARETASARSAAEQSKDGTLDTSGSKSAEALEAKSSAIELAGANFAEQMEAYSSVVEKTGAVHVDKLNSYSESLEKAGARNAEALNSLTSLTDKAGAFSANLLDTMAGKTSKERADEIKANMHESMSKQREMLAGSGGQGAAAAPEEHKINIIFSAEMDTNTGIINLIPSIENTLMPMVDNRIDKKISAPRE